MGGPQLTIAGKQLTFGSDGDVTDNTGTSQGTWSTQQDNLIHFNLNGADQTPLNAAYSFDENNVLSATFSTPDGTATSNAFAFQGGIEIDDATSLIYFIVDDAGNPTGFKITLFGTVSLTADSSNLTVTLPGGASVQVTGADDQQILTAARNTVADFRARDLLNFAAVTENQLAGGNFLPVNANINFAGSWDIRNSGLVFVSQVKVAGGGPPTVDLAFAGTLKGVTMGFEYFAQPGNTEMAFNISGQHVFNDGSVNWSSSIGFTGKTFTATVDVTGQKNIGSNKLTFSGKLNLSDTAGGPLSMELNISANYAIDKKGILSFTADVDAGGPTPSYDLMLSGTYKYSNLNLTFSINFTDKAGAPDLSVKIGIQGDQNSIIQNLSLVLNISPGQAQLQLSLTFSVKLMFVDGTRVNQRQAA